MISKSHTTTVTRLRAGALVFKVVDEHAIVLDMRRSEYVELNASGTLLLEGLEQGACDQDLAQRLCQCFAVDIATATNDVELFVARCRDLGWVSA